MVLMPDVVQSASQPLELTELLTLMVEVSERINSTLDLDELMTRIAEIVKRAINYNVFAILLLNETNPGIAFPLQHRPPGRGGAEHAGPRWRGDCGAGGSTWRWVRVNQSPKDPGYIRTLSPVRSELGVPLITNNRLIGVMDLESPGRTSSMILT